MSSGAKEAWDDYKDSIAETDRQRVLDLEQEYNYITDNYTYLNTKLADITVYELLHILDKLKGAKERARWSKRKT
jgi:hypothetical protein